MTKIIYIIVGVIISVATLNKTQAQTPLTFEEALEKTLSNNYDIQVAKINAEIAENNASKATNGYLPTVSASGNYGWTFNGGTFETVQGENKFNPNSAYTFGAGLDVNYVVWDGQGRKYDYLQSQQLKELSNLEVRQLLENTILQLSSVYYDISRLEQTITSLEEAISISADRLTRAEYGYEYGQNTQLDILGAQVDLNTDSVNLINSQQELSSSQRNLNLIMGVELSEKFTASDEITLDKTLNKEELLASAKEKNIALKTINVNVLTQEYAIVSSKSGLLPSVSANAGYDYRGSNDPNGAFVTGSAITGPNATLTMSWNIFNGQSKKQVQNAELNLQSMLTQKKSTELQIEANLLNAYDQYMTSLFVLNTQKDNVETARRNFNRSEEAFKLAQITSLEFRQAQLNLLNAELQLNQSQINAKNFELSLLSLAGRV